MKRKVKAWRIHSKDIRWWVEQSPAEVRTWSTSDYMVGLVLSQRCGWVNVVISAEDPDEVAEQYYGDYREMIDAKEVIFEDTADGIRF